MANLDRPTTCLACGRPLPPQHGKGRQRRYCDATCRSAARRERVNSDLTRDDRKDYLDAVQSGGSSPLDSVVRAREHARGAEEALRLAVEQARDAGHTWQEIGDILGTSRQAAFQRFGRPIDPRTGADMAKDVLPGAAELAIALLADLVAGRWEDVRRDFDETMSAQLSADKIAEVWAQAVGTFGRYERMGEPIALRIGKHTVVNVPISCEAGELTGRVTYNPDGTVGGLFLLPA